MSASEEDRGVGEKGRERERVRKGGRGTMERKGDRHSSEIDVRT